MATWGNVQFKPADLGRVAVQGETIKNSLYNRDPNRPRNQLATQHVQNAQQLNTQRGTQFDQGQQMKNAQLMLRATGEIMANPMARSRYEPLFKANGLMGETESFDSEDPAETQREAADLNAKYQEMLRNEANLAQGNTYGQPKAGREGGKDVYFQTDKAGNTRTLPGYSPPPKTPLVNIEGDKAESIAMAKVRADQYKGISERADNAETMLSNIDQLAAMDIQTGALEPAKALLGSMVEGFGIDAGGLADVATAQAFESVSNRMVNDVLNAAKGPQTEGDAQRAKSTIASLKNDPRANQFIMGSMKSVALRKILQRDFIEERLDEGEKLYTARREWNAYKKGNPSLSSVIKTPDGLPMFYFQFQQHAKNRRPGISEEEIVAAWREKHAE